MPAFMWHDTQLATPAEARPALHHLLSLHEGLVVRAALLVRPVPHDAGQAPGQQQLGHLQGWAGSGSARLSVWGSGVRVLGFKAAWPARELGCGQAGRLLMAHVHSRALQDQG